MLKVMVRRLWQRRRWVLPETARVPLVPTAVLLVLVQFAGVWAWRDARSTNQRWLKHESDYSYQSPRAPAIEHLLHQFSDEIATHSCEIGPPTPCDDIDATSPALASVNMNDLPGVSQDLLKKHGYSSADHLLEALLFNGQEAAVPATLLALVRTGKLSPFAVHTFLNRWFLAPAIDYYRTGRAEDSVLLFLRFVEAEIAALTGGTRFSGVGGVDITDIPVLFEAFCREPRTETPELKRCAAPFLNALAAATTKAAYWDPISQDVSDFLAKYSASPGRNEALVSYLTKEQEIGQLAGSLDGWDPDTLPPGARHLGHYVKGRHLLATAKLLPLECSRRAQTAKLELQRARELEGSTFFQRAIVERMEEASTQLSCIVFAR
jgi:hypothetical protein